MVLVQTSISSSYSSNEILLKFKNYTEVQDYLKCRATENIKVFTNLFELHLPARHTDS